MVNVFAGSLLKAWFWVILLWSPVLVVQADSGLTVTSAYSFALPPGQQAAAVYMTLENDGVNDLRLVGVSASNATHGGFHQTVHEGDMVRMRPISELVVKPGQPVILKPQGYHVMLSGTDLNLVAGESFTLILEHEDYQTTEVTVAVRSFQDAPPADDGATHQHH